MGAHVEVSLSSFEGSELKLTQQREMIGRIVGVGAPDHPPLLEPIFVDRTQKSLESQEVEAVEDVVDHTFEVVGEVGVDDLLFLVGTAYGEVVGYLGFVVMVDAAHTRGVARVGEVLEIRMRCGHPGLSEVLDNTGLGERVEIPTQQEGNTRGIWDWRLLSNL